MSKYRRIYPPITPDQHFTYWRTLYKSPKVLGGPNRTYWYCQCICNSKHHVRADQLVNGKSKSCGCLKSAYLFNCENKQFNCWTVLKIDKIINTHRYALCRCVCGYESLRRLSSIKQGASKSCGCQPKNYPKTTKKCAYYGKKIT